MATKNTKVLFAFRNSIHFITENLKLKQIAGILFATNFTVVTIFLKPLLPP